MHIVISYSPQMTDHDAESSVGDDVPKIDLAEMLEDMDLATASAEDEGDME